MQGNFLSRDSFAAQRNVAASMHATPASKVHDSELEALRIAIGLANQQLTAAQERIDELSRQNDALRQRLLNVNTPRRNDSFNWGLEPGVGL
jgi:hypothetical protein